MRYINISVTKDENGKYEKAIIRFEENGFVSSFEEYGHEQISNHLSYFSIQENCSRASLVEKGMVKITPKMRRAGTYPQNKPLNSLESNYPVHSREHESYLINAMEKQKQQKEVKAKVIKIATVGTITILALGIGANYVIKRNNAYNNQYVKLSQYSKMNMDYSTINYLSKYDDFHEIMTLLVSENYQEVDAEKLPEFFEYLDGLLDTNLDIFDEYIKTGNQVKKPAYEVRISQYLIGTKEGSLASTLEKQLNEEFGKMTSQRNYKNVNFDDYKSKLIDYALNLYRIYSGQSYSYYGYQHNVNNAEAIVNYVILRSALPVIERLDFEEYNFYSKDSIIKTIEKRIESAKSEIIHNVLNSQKNSNRTV